MLIVIVLLYLQFLENNELKMDHIIYTDGSCHSILKIGGWASAIFVGEEKIILKGMVKDTTHQRMELLAVIESLSYVRANFQRQGRTVIYTDSQYVVNIPIRKEKMKAAGFLTKKELPVRNDDLVKELIGFIESMEVTFNKVKAHQKGDAHQNQNHEVDVLARQIIRDHKRSMETRSTLS